jgi:hypothetical protein
MYQLFKFDGVDGSFELLKEATDLASLVSEKKRMKEKFCSFLVFYNPSSDKPVDESDMTKIYAELFQVNEGILQRITKGASIGKKPTSVCCGEGTSCFCVITQQEQYCEAYYCNEQGYCWAVRCPIPCGC